MAPDVRPSRICNPERLRPWRPHTRSVRWWRGVSPLLAHALRGRLPVARPGRARLLLSVDVVLVASAHARRVLLRARRNRGRRRRRRRRARAPAAVAGVVVARRTPRTCRSRSFPPRGRSRACSSHGNWHTERRSRRRRDRHSRLRTRRRRGGCICASSVCTPSLPYFPPACTCASRCVLDRSRRCRSRACAWTVSPPHQPPGWTPCSRRWPGRTPGPAGSAAAGSAAAAGSGGGGGLGGGGGDGFGAAPGGYSGATGGEQSVRMSAFQCGVQPVSFLNDVSSGNPFLLEPLGIVRVAVEFTSARLEARSFVCVVVECVASYVLGDGILLGRWGVACHISGFPIEVVARFHSLLDGRILPLVAYPSLICSHATTVRSSLG